MFHSEQEIKKIQTVQKKDYIVRMEDKKEIRDELGIDENKTLTRPLCRIVV